jgi:hypothetical protein
LNAVGHKQLFGRTADLLEEAEKYLANQVLKLEERRFGLTRKDLQPLAYEIGVVRALCAVTLINRLA